MRRDVCSGRTDSFVRRLLGLLGATYERWWADRTIRLGAGLAYYGLFTVIPLLALSIAVAQTIFSEDDVKSFLENALTSLFGSDAAQTADDVVDKLESSGVTTGIGLVGVVSLIVASSVVFVAVEDAMNVIWGVPPTHGLKNLLRRYGRAYLVVLIAGSLLVTALLTQSISGLAEDLVPGQIDLLDSLADLLAALATWAAGIGALALLFRFLPRAHVRWRAALVGAAVTAFFVAVGTWALGEYIQRVGNSSLAGVLGTAVLLGAWIYYIAQVLLAGAVLTRVLNDELMLDSNAPQASAPNTSPGRGSQ